MSDGPLPSWNNGIAKSAILDFVARVTTEGGPDFVRPAERIATFDNDGTLWCEQPLQEQLFFLSIESTSSPPRTCRCGSGSPSRRCWSVITRRCTPSASKRVRAVFATHAGMSEEEFYGDRAATGLQRRGTRSSAGCSSNARTGRRSSCSAICARTDSRPSSSPAAASSLIRAFAEEAYDIPREQVIGSSVKLRFEMKDGRVALMKLSELNSFDDREVKAQNIGLHIGRRPILAFGNSDGDLAMLRYTQERAGRAACAADPPRRRGARVRLRPRVPAEPAGRGARQGQPNTASPSSA